MRYLIGLLVAIVVIIFIIIKLLSGGGSAVQPTPLEDYALTDTTMRMELINATQASQNHYEAEIVVGRSDATLTLYKGYQGDIVRTRTYPMNTLAYRDFLRSLDLSVNYTNGNDTKAYEDESGYCALGSKAVYEIVDGSGSVIQHYWSSSCGDKTYRGDVSRTQDLFKKQIPDFYDLTKDVSFN